MEGPLNRPISEVHPNLRRCTEKIAEFSNSIRELLDAVVVASESDKKTDILTTWNSRNDLLADHKRSIQQSAEVALDFTDDPTYVQLPKREQERYWNYLVRANNRFQILSEQLQLYSLLSRIDHTEQTVDFLWSNFRSMKGYFLILHAHKEIKSRGFSMYKKRCILARDRLYQEMCDLMNLLEEVVVHPAFDSMDRERRELYHAKWRMYLGKFANLDKS
ncbi:hypothetical protein KA057_02500 [Candidatus Gracilibacteria bacterium]|nr:hypothetical protein [Candidatus Gracilibacteria bacterium]